MTKPTLWVHAMIKNEARWLWYSINSVIDHVDKIMLWDTGSTDNTNDIVTELRRKYPNKIDFQKRTINTPGDFTKIRQEMLNETKSDWFMMLDGDEIWWDDSIRNILSVIIKDHNKFESIVVPTVNLVGDIYHYQDKSSGKYKFGNLEGHYNLRFINRNIEGLHSQGVHGVWGWADKNNRMIQDRGSFKFIDAPYLHATSIERSDRDREVIKRKKKLKYEIGTSFPRDFYYPESLFKDKPNFVESPWRVMSDSYRFRAFFETPLRKIKKRLIKGKVGY